MTIETALRRMAKRKLLLLTPAVFIEDGIARMHIPLTQGLFATIDADDYNLIKDYSWFAHKSRRTFYASAKCKGETVKMHRVIMKAPPHLEVDHWNKDGLVNTRINLRLVTQAVNKQNKQQYLNNKSGVTGVYRFRERWIAQLTFQGKQMCLGRFTTIEEAIVVRQKAEKEYFGATN